MNEVVYAYCRPRHSFGRPAVFHDAPPEVLVDIHPDPQLQAEYAVAHPCEKELQCVPEVSEQWTNTARITRVSRGMHHGEGGWPKEVDPQETEHKVRYRKKVETEEHYTGRMRALAKETSGTLNQNNAIDIYEDYFPDLDANASSFSPDTSGGLQTITVLGDPSRSKSRTPAFLSWNPSDSSQLAVAYCNLSRLGTATSSLMMSLGEPTTSYLWDITNSNSPLVTFQPPSPLTVLQFHPKDSHTLAAGCYNGLVCTCDVRCPRLFTTSKLEDAHRHLIHDLQWLSKPTEFMSVSTDARVLLWDTKRLDRPLDCLELRHRLSRSRRPHGGICLDCNTNAGGSSRFMVGTDQGAAMMCSRRGRIPQDRILAVYQDHHGPVYSVQRLTACPKFFLTVGDWRVNIWADDLLKPLYTTAYHPSYLTGACWHPQRPAVFLTIQSNGMLEVWDLLRRQVAPSLSVLVANIPLHALRLHPHGQLLAIATTRSTVHLRRLGSAYTAPVANEGELVKAVLETYARNFHLRQRQVDPTVVDAAADFDIPVPDSSALYQLTTDYVMALEAAGISTTLLEMPLPKTFTNADSVRSTPRSSSPNSPSLSSRAAPEDDARSLLSAASSRGESCG